MLLFGTGMNDQSKSNYHSLAARLKINVAKEMSNNVTHIIFDSKDNDKACNRTINFMKGILMGIWIVSIEWLKESETKGYLLEENNFEAAGSHKNTKAGGPFNGRLNAARQVCYPKLFEDCNFYFYGTFNVFTKLDLIKLVQMGGGNILKREPKLERADELKSDEIPHHIDKSLDCNFKCSNFILYEANDKVKDIKHDFLRACKISWLFNCIDYFTILNTE
jgi:BRCA1-associated RING domain protein 1